MVTFSNPRLEAHFTDWPSGKNRVPCTFTLEYNARKGWRFVRQTTGKPKTATFGGKGAIVDGSDGRTYLIQNAGNFDFIHVWSSNFMEVGEEVVGKRGGVFPKDERYEELKGLIALANKDTE